MNADGGDFVITGLGTLVQRLNVGQNVLEFVRPGVNGALRQSVKHEGVIGVRAVRQPNAHGPGRYGLLGTAGLTGSFFGISAGFGSSDFAAPG